MDIADFKVMFHISQQQSFDMTDADLDALVEKIEKAKEKLSAYAEQLAAEIGIYIAQS